MSTSSGLGGPRAPGEIAAFWAWAGAAIGAATILHANATSVGRGATDGERLVVLACSVAAVGLGAALVSRAPTPLAGMGPMAELPFSALLLVAGSTIVAIGGYAPGPDVIGSGIAVGGAAVLGSGLHGPGRLLPGDSGTIAAATAVAAAGAGILAILVVPGALTALSEYAVERIWVLGRPDSPSTARAYLLIGVVAALGAATFARRHAAMLERVGLERTGLARAGLDEAEEASLVSASIDRHHDEALLEVRGVDLSYGSVQILFDVSVHVEPGECVALLGTNGAGKSTLLRAVYGLKAPDAGRVWFDGQDITGAPAESLVGRGLVQVPGGRGIFPSLTVAENLRMAAYSQPGRRDGAAAAALDRFPSLGQRLHEPAGVLSGGEQQMLALSRAYILRPKLLAIDELTLGLAPKIVAELIDFVVALKEAGIAMLLVEQSVTTALQFADRAYFLERGQVRFEGDAQDLLDRPDLLRSVFLAGADTAGTEPAGAEPAGARR